jgi:CheY-like chemotaxis protein
MEAKTAPPGGEISLPPLPSAAAKSGKRRILLVDDSKINQLVARGMLQKMGYQVTVAGNGQEALEALRQHDDHDLVLMDCQMPEMDGYEATRAIRSGQAGWSQAKIPVLAMTANTVRGDREKCLAAGMNDYLTKPVMGDLLAQALAKWLPAQ